MVNVNILYDSYLLHTLRDVHALQALSNPLTNIIDQYAQEDKVKLFHKILENARDTSLRVAPAHARKCIIKGEEFSIGQVLRGLRELSVFLGTFPKREHPRTEQEESDALEALIQKANKLWFSVGYIETLGFAHRRAPKKIPGVSIGIFPNGHETRLVMQEITKYFGDSWHYTHVSTREISVYTGDSFSIEIADNQCREKDIG